MNRILIEFEMIKIILQNKMSKYLRYENLLGRNPLKDIPTITVTDFGQPDSSSSEESDASENSAGDGDTGGKKVKKIIRGSNYLATRKDYEFGGGEASELKSKWKNLEQLSDWETDETDEEHVEKCTPKSDPPEPQQDQFDDFSPENFGYVSLTDKILSGYIKGMQSDETVPNNRFKREKSYDEGGEMMIAMPKIVLENPVDTSDLVGIKNVEEILNSPDLTISQKYRMLGVEEEFDEEPEEGTGCWEWFIYKLNNLYLAQWPMAQVLS